MEPVMKLRGKYITTFEHVKIGDKVWSYDFKKWGTVAKIISTNSYPIIVKFENIEKDISYNTKGERCLACSQTLFWDEISFDIPKKDPVKLKLNDMVFVANSENEKPKRRYFSHYMDNGTIACFTGGKTVWSNESEPTETWSMWEKVKENDFPGAF
jgi:hypothetical protein